MAVFTWIPDTGATEEAQPRLLTASFGDAYEQNAADGLNSDMRPRSLSFTGRSSAEIAAIDAFLTARNGATSFDYTHPGGASKKYLCKKWKLTDTDYGRALTCEFQQVPA